MPLRSMILLGPMVRVMKASLLRGSNDMCCVEETVERIMSAFVTCDRLQVQGQGPSTLVWHCGYAFGEGQVSDGGWLVLTPGLHAAPRGKLASASCLASLQNRLTVVTLLVEHTYWQILLLVVYVFLMVSHSIFESLDLPITVGSFKSFGGVVVELLNWCRARQTP